MLCARARLLPDLATLKAFRSVSLWLPSVGFGRVVVARFVVVVVAVAVAC